MQTDELPSPILGRDRSPSGPPLRWSAPVVVRLCGGPSLWGSVSVGVRLCGRGAFGEIALPRKCVGEVEFAVGTRDADR